MLKKCLVSLLLVMVYEWSLQLPGEKPASSGSIFVSERVADENEQKTKAK